MRHANARSLELVFGDASERVCIASAEEDTDQAFLSQREKTTFEALRFAAKRTSFLIGRLAAKRALAELLEEPDLRRIEIRSGIYGQPLVDHPRAGALSVSVTHSHGLALAIAFPSAVPMGIDLETTSAMSEDAVRAVTGELQCSATESAWLAGRSVNEATACALLWTAREALGKSLCVGVNSPLGLLALSEIRAAGRDAGDESGWRGRYLNFPRCQWIGEVEDGRVWSLALPLEARLAAGLSFRFT